MLRKILPLILSIVLAFTACGGSDSKTTEATEATSSEEARSSSGAEDPTKSAAEDPTKGGEKTEEAFDPGPHTSTKDYVGRTYGLSIWSSNVMDAETIYLTEDGKIYDGLGDVEEVYDIFTGELKYYAVERCEYTENYEDQNPEFALYDLEGNLLIPYDGAMYGDCIGDYVVRKTYSDWWEEIDPETNECGLYNVKTGEYKIDQVAYIRSYGEYAAAYDSAYEIIGFLDENAKPVAGFYKDSLPGDFPGNYSNGYYLFKNERLGLYILTDSNFDEVFTGDINEYISVGSSEVKGDYFFVEKDDHFVFYTYEGLKKVYEGDFKYLDYFDGTFIIKSPENYKDYLCDLKDNVIAGPCDLIVSDSNWESREPGNFFIACSGSEITKIDRNGNTVASITISGYTNFSFDFCGDYIVANGAAKGANGFKYFVLDMDLNEIKFPEKFTSVIPLALYNDNPEIPKDMFVGSYETRYGFTRKALLDSAGNVVADGFKYLESSWDKIIAVKGTIIGFIDTAGNWISGDYIYESNLGEDR